jgi:hypothetical protein
MSVSGDPDLGLSKKGMDTKCEPPRPNFLQAQLTYFTSHLSLADAKAAGVLIFSVAVSGVTADKLTWTGIPPLRSGNWFGIAALAFSALAGCV